MKTLTLISQRAADFGFLIVVVGIALWCALTLQPE